MFFEQFFNDPVIIAIFVPASFTSLKRRGDFDLPNANIRNLTLVALADATPG